MTLMSKLRSLFAYHGPIDLQVARALEDKRDIGGRIDQVNRRGVRKPYAQIIEIDAYRGRARRGTIDGGRKVVGMGYTTLDSEDDLSAMDPELL